MIRNEPIIYVFYSICIILFIYNVVAIFTFKILRVFLTFNFNYKYKYRYIFSSKYRIKVDECKTTLKGDYLACVLLAVLAIAVLLALPNFIVNLNPNLNPNLDPYLVKNFSCLIENFSYLNENKFILVRTIDSVLLYDLINLLVFYLY